MDIVHYGERKKDREVTKKGREGKRQKKTKGKQIKFCPITAGAEA